MGHDFTRDRDQAGTEGSAAKKKDTYDTVKQIRLSQDLFEKANAVFARKGLSFSEAVRLFLELTAQKKRLPFRASNLPGYGAREKAAEEEARFVTEMLGIGKGSVEKRLLHAIFGDGTSEDLTDAQLEEWAERTGLPGGMDPATLAELYDFGVFEKDPYRGSFDGIDNCDAGSEDCDYNCAKCAMWTTAFIAKKENARENLRKAFDRMYASSVDTASRMALPCGELFDGEGR